MATTAKLGWGRKLGIVGLVLSWGVACTQLFGDDRQNTLAPIARPNLPGVAMSQPTGMPGVVAVCGAGDVRCEGALLQICADDGSSWVTTQRCAAAALCQANPATCLAATCSAEEMTCSGSVLQKCNADRTGWDLFATCLSPAHCNAGQRQCLPEPCTPGERRCDRSETDQSPVLEVCRDDRQDWGPLDACVTRELCDQTLTSGGTSGPVLGPEGMPQVLLPGAPAAVVSCLLPACAVGEVRCEGARLEFCSEGRTGWNVAEECASAALCEASRASASLTGTPQCLAPACGVGQHQCTATGVLQVCSDDRTGFVDQEACIGPPFCNAAVADRGEAGCLAAPCEAGQMQCNGAQVQICRDDRTALDPSGAPCESAALCNADDPTNAFCEDPVCRRGATSGDEFHCEGAQLQRCNESLTIYDTIQTCVTPELCDASQRANGCKTPACQPGQHACNGGFLQTCNAGQTAFENTENCGSQAQCDANAGRCADPCEVGSQRCNATTGDLEQCNDLLTGWQPIADCPNVQLCDLQNGRCDICLGGQFSCADNQLRQCSADGGTFSRQNIGPECAPLPNNAGVGVRVCQNNAVVVTPCQFGCTNGVCLQCQPNTSQCVNGNQIRRCGADGFFGATTSCVDSNLCDGAETCNPQTNSCTTTGTALACNDSNRCTNDSCNPNPGGGCAFTAVNNSQQCAANALLQRCVNGQPQDTQCDMTLGCLANQCAVCGIGQCNGTQFTPCTNGQRGGAVNCPDDGNNNPCVSPACNPQTGCGLQNVTGPCTVNGATGTCQGGTCQICTPNQNLGCANNQSRTCNNTGTAVNAQDCPDDNNQCTTPACNGQTCGSTNRTGACTIGNQPGTCQGGQCQPSCTGTGSCNGTTFTSCNNGTPGNPQPCTDNNPNDCTVPLCTNTGCNTQPRNTGACTSGGVAGTCQQGTCRVCTPNGFVSCVGNTLTLCNSTGTGTVPQNCPTSCTQNQTTCNFCLPRSFVSCRGDSLTLCNTTGSANAAAQNCPEGCTQDQPFCNICRPGSQCSGSDILTCEGTFESITESCANGCENTSATTARCIPIGTPIGGLCPGADGNLIPCP